MKHIQLTHGCGPTRSRLACNPCLVLLGVRTKRRLKNPYNTSPCRLFLLVGGLTLLVLTGNAGDKQYTITHLGDVPGKSMVLPYRNAINQRGQVVGYGWNTFIGDEQSFIWSGEMVMLPNLPGAVFSRPQAINDHGHLVGEIGFNILDRPAAVWDKGVLRVLPSAPGVSTPAINIPFGINNRGDVVGTSGSRADVIRHPVLWLDGEASILQTPPGSTESRAYGINDSGEIVGFAAPNLAPATRQAMLWADGEATILPTLGGVGATAYCIANNGDIAGSAALPSGLLHAVLWQDEVAIDLGTLGGTTSLAYSCNTRGQAVGESRTAISPAHAFLWQDGQMVDLNDVIPENSGWELQVGMAINNRGLISGFGLYQGAVRAYILTPRRKGSIP